MNLYNFKFWYLWIFVVLYYLALAYLTNQYIYTDSFYRFNFFGKIDAKRIDEIIIIRNKYKFLGYLFLPIIMILKLGIIAGIIYTGLYLTQQNVTYKNCLKISLFAELVSVVAMLIKTAWLMVDTPNNAKDLQSFSPLSISQLLNLEKVPSYLIYPVQLINIFEIAYWMVLAYGIMVFTKQDWVRSLKTVASSYGVALFIWVVFIVFIQVQFT